MMRQTILVTVHHGATDDEVCQLMDQIRVMSGWVHGVSETTGVAMIGDTDPRHRARRSDPETSKAAAAVQTPKRMTEARQRLLTLIEQASPRPLSDHELLDMWIRRWGPVAASGPRTRRCELVEMCLIVKVDENGLSPSGLACSRWTVIF